MYRVVFIVITSVTFMTSWNVLEVKYILTLHTSVHNTNNRKLPTNNKYSKYIISAILTIVNISCDYYPWLGKVNIGD